MLMKIWMKVKNTHNSAMVKGFLMYFVSQELYNILKLNSNGITMTADSRIKGYVKFEASAQNIRNLEDDPMIKCKNYMKPNGYDEVSITFNNIVDLDELFKNSNLVLGERILKPSDENS